MQGEGQTLKLHTGALMPQVGIGCWKIPNGQTADIVYDAIKEGYRCVDEACDYGNEKEAVQGIKRALDDGIIKREDLFVTSKLWNTYHKKEHVKTACLKTLDDLGLQYLDLYLIHFPISLKFVPFEKRYPPGWDYDPDNGVKMQEDLTPLHETWAAMEELVNEGLVKHIGVSNMGAVTIRDICSYAKVKPAVLQIEVHPLNVQQRLIRFCQEQGIQVTAFSSFGAMSYVELDMAGLTDTLFEHEAIKSIAGRAGKTPAQVLLRWAVQRGLQVIPKSTKVERLRENQDLVFELTEDEMKAISALDQRRRFNDPAVFAEAAFGMFYPIYE